jgi:hypothetical protein
MFFNEVPPMHPDDFLLKLLKKGAKKSFLDATVVGQTGHGKWAPVMDKVVETDVGKKFVKTVASTSYGKELWGEAAKNGCNKALRETTIKIVQHGGFAFSLVNDIRHTCQGDMSTEQLFKGTTAKSAGYCAGLWATGFAAVWIGTGPVGWVAGACFSIAVNTATTVMVDSALCAALG